MLKFLCLFIYIRSTKCSKYQNPQSIFLKNVVVGAVKHYSISQSNSLRILSSQTPNSQLRGKVSMVSLAFLGSPPNLKLPQIVPSFGLMLHNKGDRFINNPLKARRGKGAFSITSSKLDKLGTTKYSSEACRIPLQTYCICQWLHRTEGQTQQLTIKS